MDWTEVLAVEDENQRARLAAELLAIKQFQQRPGLAAADLAQRKLAADENDAECSRKAQIDPRPARAFRSHLAHMQRLTLDGDGAQGIPAPRCSPGCGRSQWAASARHRHRLLCRRGFDCPPLDTLFLGAPVS